MDLLSRMYTDVPVSSVRPRHDSTLIGGGLELDEVASAGRDDPYEWLTNPETVRIFSITVHITQPGWKV